jgi:hypothetical protein
MEKPIGTILEDGTNRLPLNFGTNYQPTNLHYVTSQKSKDLNNPMAEA